MEVRRSLGLEGVCVGVRDVKGRTDGTGRDGKVQGGTGRGGQGRVGFE